MSPAFVRRLSSWLVITTAITLAAGYGAQVFQWDPDTNSANNNVPNTGSGFGRAGTWTTGANQWWSGAGADTTWNNSAFNIAEFGGLSSGTVNVGAPIVAGGLTFKTGGYVVTPSASNTLSLQVAPGDPAPVITANASATIGVTGVSGITGNQGVTKRGGGTLTVLGNNTGFSGTITLESGTLEISGGSDTGLSGTKSLGNAQPIRLEGGILRFLNDSGIAIYNNDITMRGTATINVDRVSSGTNSTVELGALNLGPHTLTTTNGNTYGLRFNGVTTLGSASSTINATFNPPVAVIGTFGATTLAGQVTGTGALNKIGAGTLFLADPSFGTNINDYSGGTNIFAGTLSLADELVQLGTGKVVVHPNATLRIAGNLNFFNLDSIPGALSLQSSSAQMSVLAFEADLTPDSPTLQSALIGRYGAVVQLRTATGSFQSVFDFSKFGTGAGGNVFLGASANTTVNNDPNQIIAGADNVYRLGANNAAGTVLTLAFPNAINGGAGKSLEIGVPIQNVQNITNSTGTVNVTESQNYGGVTTINTGSTLLTGGSGPADPARLGSGTTINIYGTLSLGGGDYTRLNQTIFNVNQARGTNGAMILTVTDPAFAGVGSTNARIPTASILNFNGGTLTFNGYASGNAGTNEILSQQNISQFNFSAANVISLTTGTAPAENLDTVLRITNLNRVSNGTLAFSSTGVASVGTRTANNDTRLSFTNLNGSAPVVTNGMLAPWLIDISSFNLPGGNNATTTIGSPLVTVTTLDGLVPGMIITGTGIPAGAAVTAVNAPVKMTGGSTNGTNTVTVLSTAGLLPGMLVSGPSIPSGSRVLTVDSGTTFTINTTTGTQVNLTVTSTGLFTLSNNATATNAGATYNVTGNQFVTYDPTESNPGSGINGVRPTGFDVYATSASALQGAATTAKVAITSAFATTANSSVYALRIGDVALTGTNKVTIGAGAPASDGAGLILSQATAREHTVDFEFGAGGNREAVIYVTGGQTATLSGSVSANGLTKFGSNTLFLTGANSNLNGTIVINQGAIDGNPIGFNYRPVILNAGTLNFDSGGSANVGSAVTVNGDSIITAGDVEVPRIASLTINVRPQSTEAIVFNIGQGLSVTGNTVLNGDVNWNNTRGDRNSDVRARVLLAGKVTGAGSFIKWSGGITTSGTTAFLNGANDYLGSTTVNGGVLESLTAVGTPFSTGAITVNPGGLLRIVSPTNIANNALTVTSDSFGLGVLALAYGGAMAPNGGFTGTMNYNYAAFGGPFSAVVAIDALGYSGAINMNTLAGGRAFLGTSLGGNFSGALTPSTINALVPDLNGGVPQISPNAVYRLGGGGSGFLNLVGAPNQLTGNRDVQIGAISNVTQGASVMLFNGNQNTNNQGAVQILNANNYTGLTILNGGTSTTGFLQPAALSVGHNQALGTSKIVFNGGAIMAPTNVGLPFLNETITLNNSIGFTGDAVFNGSTNLILAGNVSLGDNQVGVNRTFTVNNTGGLIIFTGNISNGAGTADLSSITKNGNGAIEFRGTGSTYTGFTNINAGAIVVSSDTSIPLSSQITFGSPLGSTGGSGVTGSIGVWNSSFTTNRSYIIQNGANGTFDVGAGKILTQSTLSNISGIGADTALLKNGYGTLVLNGHNSFSATGSWAIRILNGIVEVNSNVNLGDPDANKGVVVQGGTLRITDNFTSGRQIINGALTGGVGVAAGKTFISTGLLNSNGGTNVLTKTGTGTLQNDFNNANLDRFTIQNGTFSSSGFSAMADFDGFTANTNSNNNLTNLSTAINRLYVGQLVTGSGIAANTRITDINYQNGTVTLSANTTATATGVSLLTGEGGILSLNGGTFELVDRPVTSVVGTSTVAIGNSLVTVDSTAGLRVGQSVTGANITGGTTILAIKNSTTFLLSNTPSLANTNPTTFTLGAAGNSQGIGNIAYGGGGRLKVESSPGLSSQLTIGDITRFANGTMIVDPGTSNLGVAGDGNNVRVIPVNSIHGIAPGSANVNGILAPSIITRVNNVGNFATYTGATTGIASYSGATVSSLSGLQPTAIGSISANQVLTGTNRIYAFRTTSNLNISDGTIVLPSVNANFGGGIIINNNVNISSNLVFDPTSTVTYGLTAGATTVNTPNLTVASTVGLMAGMPIAGPNIPAGTFIAAVTSATGIRLSANATATATGQSLTVSQGGQFSGEGLLYTAPNATATISGNVTAGSFTKFGAGTVVFAGTNNGILGALTIQDGTLRVAPGANFARLQTDLVLNGNGVFDLNGNSARFSSIGNSNPLGGGLITNTGTSDATFSIIATAPTQSGPLTRQGTVGQNNQVINNLSSTADLAIGMPVFGTNVAAGAVIRSIDSASQITLSAPGNNANVGASIQQITFGALYSGLISDGPTNKLTIEKSGAGIITLGAFNVAFPDAGNNTYTGGTTLNQGTLLVQNPLALGGANGTTPGTVSLFGGTLDLRSNGGGNKGVITLGNQSTNGVNVAVYGPVTINVDRLNSTAIIGNDWQINNLLLSENTLTTTGANSYGLRVAGTTTIAGNYANINSASDQSNGNVQFIGPIIGSGAFNKYGTALQRVTTIAGSANTYSGGTNVLSGGLQVTATTGTPLGTGRVNVFPGGMLRIAGLSGSWQPGAFSSVPGQAQLRVHGYFNSLGIVGLDNSFNPAALLNAASFSNAYGTMGLALSTPFFTQALDMSTIGDGRAYLISGLNTEVAYLAPTLAPGVGNGVAPRTYRLAGGVNNLAFTGADNVLNDTSAVGTSLQVGSLNSIFGTGGAITGTGNAVIIRNSNNFTGGTWIGKGSAVSIGVGSSPAGSTPLGSANGLLNGAATNVVIYGTLQLEDRLDSSFFNAATGRNANNYILRPGGQIILTDFAGEVAGGSDRWADTDGAGGGLNLNGGTFRYNGAQHIVSEEQVGTFTADKGSRIIISQTNNSGTAALYVNDLVRANRGTMMVQALLVNTTSANDLGIPARDTVQLQQTAGFSRLIVNNAGSAAVALGGTTALGPGVLPGRTGIVPAWLISGSANSFLGYNPTAENSGYQSLVSVGSPGASVVAADGTFTPGVNQIGYSKVIVNNGALSGSISLGANDTVDINTSATGVVTLNNGDTSVYALRTNRDINPGGAGNTLTIVSGGLINITNTVTINTSPAASNNTEATPMNLNFGVNGTGEALIYSTSTMTINAQIKAAGLTRFTLAGNGSNLILTANNNLTAPVIINQGLLQGQNTLSGIGTPVGGVFNNQDVYLQGSINRDASRLILRGAVGDAYGSALATLVEATTQFGGTIFVNGDSRIDTNASNYVQRINNLTFANLGANSPIGLALGNVYVAGTTTLGANDNYIEGFANNYIGSVLGGLVQGGTLTKFGNGTMLLAGTANTYANTVINEGTINTATSILGSLTRTGNPFGNGPITINPGAMLRLADASNIAGKIVTLNSSGVGLGGLAIAYNSTTPISDLFGTGPGKVNLVTTGDFKGVIALDINNYINPINMAALEAAAGGKLFLGTSISATYFGQTLTPASDNVYRLGGGGNQGNLTIGAGSFANVLTGTASVVIGAQTAGINPNGPVYINGNFGSVILTNRNDFSGGLTLNNQSGLTLNNSFAAGTGAIRHNGGNLTLNNTVSIANDMQIVSDVFSTSGGTNAAFTGKLNLAPSGVGGTITMNMAGGGQIGFQNEILGAPLIGGTLGSNIIKTGGQTVIFNGNNTFRGTTTVINGFLGLGTDVSPNVPGALGINDVPVILGNAGTNTAGSLLLGGQIIVDRGLNATGGNGTGINTLRGQSLNRSTFSGGIAVTGSQLNIDQVSSNNGTFRGGVLDVQGSISGTGLVQIGNTNVQGSVRLSASANGYGTSTVSGGVTLQAGRLQINANTYYTGPADNPTIISGPLGTGTFTFGPGNGNAGGEIVAYGADRVIVNPLGNLNTAANTTLTFGGHYNLTFTRDLNINSDGTLRTRTFNVLASQGITAFSGILSNGSAGSTLIKNGAGTLELSGTNTFFGTNQIALNAGVLQFYRDENLGRISTTASNIQVGAAATLALLGSTPVVWTSGVSNHVLNLTGAGFIDVRDANGSFTINTAPTGAFVLGKQGAGTLALNSGTNAMTGLIIGGSPAAAAANLPSGTFGGVVSTTATSGTPFSNSVTIYDGTLSLVGGGSAQSLTIGTVTFAAGSSIQLNRGSTTSLLTATALTRTNQGTLVIVPSLVANLGAASNFEQLKTSTSFTTTNAMLALPTVVLRDPSGDLNYVQYGANGFAQHATTTTASLAASAATNLADLSLSTAVANAATDIYAVRTSANITSGGASSLLRILNGGLIFNGATAPNVSSNVYFGNGTTPVEALVYVRGGQTGTSTLSGSFTATNFTKSGLGNLLISGTNNVMAGSSTALQTLQINDGTVRFAGQSSLPSNGLITISPMDGAALDLNGQNLTIAALGGQSVATAATGRVINSGAFATLTLASQTGVSSNSNGYIIGNLALAKTGVGTVILGYNNEYSGGTTVGVGSITNASGLFNALGTLQIGSFNSLGTGVVNLAGGTLDLRNPIAPNEVQDNIDVITLGPGDGYNFVVKGLNTFGSANTTSTIASTSTTGFQAINSLTFETNAAGLYALSTAGGSDNGLLVRGATTLVGNTTFNLNRNAVLAGKVAGTGRTVTKMGTNTLFLTNTERGIDANDVAAWNLAAGTLEVRMSQGGTNPLANNSTVVMGAATLNIRHDGDNLSDPQVLSDFATNTLQIGSILSLSTTPTGSTGYIASPNTTLNIGSLSGSTTATINKTLQFKQLVSGGTLGSGFLTLNLAVDNKYTVEFVNGLTMVKDAYLALNNTGGSLANMTLSGQISGNGTLYKQGGGELDINAVATNTGGTVLAAGDTFFGSFQGQTRTLSTTAKLGPGNISIQPGARLRFNAITNLNGGQQVEVRSSIAALGLVGIGDNTSIDAYNIRAPFAAGAFSNSTIAAPLSGSGVLALNSLYNASIIDLSRIGDGTWFLGSTSDGSGLNTASSLDGRYTSAQLLPGAAFAGIGNSNRTYRLGGGAGTLYIGLAQTGSAGNQLFGNANLVVGADLTNGTGGTVTNGNTLQSASGSAGIILNQTQSYTGSTVVNRGSQLEFRGGMSTSGYEVFGILVAGGTTGSFVGGVNPTIRQGGQVNLDNQFDLMPVASTQGRWGDATAINLNSGTLRVIGNSAADLREVIGQVNAAGGSTLTPQRAFGGRIMEINAASIARVTNLYGVTGNNGQLSIEGTTAIQLGSDERVTVGGLTLAAQIASLGGITNGMVAPWMFNARDSQFLTYSDFGFVNAAFSRTISGALTSASSLATDRTQVTTAASLVPGVTLSAYALRADGNITLSTLTDTTATINIGSGGLITNGAVTISPALNFNGEAVIANNNNLFIGAIGNPTTSGRITATSIAKSGTGNLFLDGEQTTFNGNIAVNGGGLFLRATISNSKVGGNGGTIVINGYNSTVGLRSDFSGGSTFNNNILVAPGNSLAVINVDRAAGSLSTQLMILGGNLTFGGAPGLQGQTINFTTGNSYSLRIAGTTDLGPVGTAVLYNNGSAVTLAGLVTGSATLVKEGANTLFLGTSGSVANAPNTNTGGIILQNGTLQASSGQQNNADENIINSQFGSGDITLAGGTLNVRANGVNNGTYRVYTFANNDNVNVIGNTTINVDRVTGTGGTVKAIAFKNLNIGGQALAVSGTSSYSLRFNNVTITGTPTFQATNDLILNNVSDGGGGMFIVSNGAGNLWMDGTGSTYSGGTFVNAGVLRFGNPGLASSTAQAGPGLIQINAGAQIRVEAATNINTGVGQKLLLRGVNPTLAVLRAANVLTQSDLTTILDATSSNGALRIDQTFTNALNLGAIGDGTFFLGSVGNFSYTANTLGVGAGNTYRLAANNGTNDVFTLAPTTAASNVLTGTAKVVVGSLASNAPGVLFLNQTNDFNGGMTISRGNEVRFNSGTANTPLGSAQVDVFGTIRAENSNGSFRNVGGTANTNAIVLHPGATLRFENNVTAGNNDRWHDNTAVALNGSTIVVTSLNNTANGETVGTVSFERGSRATLTSNGTGQAILTVSSGQSVTRVGNGTLVFTNGGANRLGNAAGTNSERFIVTNGVVNVAGNFLNGMLPAYYIAGTDNTFVTYGANGFTRATFDSVNFAGANANSVVDLTASTTLSGDTSIYAIRVANAINSAFGQLNTLTLNGAGTVGSGGGVLFSNNAGVINTNLSFNGFEGLIYAGANGTINGDISGVSSAGITKFGTSNLTIGKDQNDAARGPGNGYSNGWTVNEGTLIASTFGALGNATGTNTVTLNGSAAGAAGLTLSANNANSLNEFYTMGNLQVTDNALINFTPGSTDRTQTLGAAGALSNIIVTSTGGLLQDAQLAFTTNQPRSILQVGTVSASGLNAGAILNVGQSATNSNITSGVSSGLSIAGLSGIAGQTFRKWGNAELYIRGASAFAGSVVIEQGPVGVFHSGSLGTGALTVKRYGTVDVNVANYTPTNSSVTYEAGSIERWSVDGARTGAVNLGGATLQVANDQTANVAQVTLNGGSIEGFQRVDDLLGTTQAVYRTLGAGVTFNLAGNSFLGQNLTQGLNGYDNGRQANTSSPLSNSAAGVILEIKGVISGVGGLTKQGNDLVTLSGANTYLGATNILNGTVRIGANNSLPVATDLITGSDAVFNLNGFDQQVGRLVSPVITSGVAGYISNTATTTNTLTVGGATNASYSGVIQYNVGVTKTGVNIQTLTNNNTYAGDTNINGGALEVGVSGSLSGSLSGTSKVDINAGGTLTGIGSAAGPINLKSGGIFSPGAAGAVASTAGVNNVGTFDAAGGFNTTGGGTLKLDLQSRYVPGSSLGVNDKINVTGAISLAGTTTIQLTLTGGYTPAFGDLFFIALNDGLDAVSGGPGNFSVGTFGGFNWQVLTAADYATGAQTGGNDIALLAVPEPNALSMLAGSLGLALGLQRFRRRRSVA